MVGTLDLTHVRDIMQAILAKHTSHLCVTAREEVVHAAAPIVLPGDSTSVRPVAINKHPQRVKLSKAITQVTVGQDALEGDPLALRSSRSAHFCFRVVDVLIMTNDVQVAADYHWLSSLRLQAIDIDLKGPIPPLNTIL